MKERITRDEMLIEVAHTVAKRSTCCRRNVGAVIARDGRIISIGYNGSPVGMPHCTPATCGPDNPCTRTIHAEANAIAFAARHGVPIERSFLYVTTSPCLDCAKLILNSGIIGVYYVEAYRDKTPIKLLHDGGIFTVHAGQQLEIPA